MKKLLLGFVALFIALAASHDEAAAAFLCNKAWVEIDSTGTADPITLGAAVSGNQTLADCGITNGQTVRYSIFDGASWEVGSGVYTSSGTTLTRVVLESSNSDTEISLSATATLVVAPLTQDMPSESTPVEATPTASDYLFAFQSSALERFQISALESTLEGFLDAADLQGDITLNTDTAGNYVATAADGTGVDGTATGEGSTYTPTLDLTEINTATWGDNTQATITQTYDTSSTGDITFDVVNNQITFDNVLNTGVSFNLDNSSLLTFFEDDGNGANFKAFEAPAALTGSTTCTFEDDANFVPDSCVGDGTDDDVPEVDDFGALVGGTGIDNNSGTLDLDLTEVTPTATFGGGSFTTLTFDAGATDPNFVFGSATARLEAIYSLRQADASNAGGRIEFLEDPGTGSNFIALLAPAAVTSNVTCTFEDDANPIPDSCVGDGTDDAGGGLSGLIDNRIIRADGTTAVQNSDASIGDTGFMQLWGLDTDLWMWHAGADAEDIEIAAIKTRHASDPFGNGVLSGSDDILTITAKGNDGNSTENFAWIYMQAASGGETIGDGDTPGEIIFGTTPDGSAAVSERYRINAAGALGIAGANFGTSNQTILSAGSAVAPAWGSIIGKKAQWINAGQIVPNFTNGCAPVDQETGTNDVMYRTCNFDTTTQESGQVQIRMPDVWNEGTVTFVPVWSHPSTATNFGVVFDLACLATSNDDALDAAFGTEQTSTDTGGTTDDVYLGPESAAITCAGTPQAGDYVTFRVRRVPANGSDTLAVDARLHGFTLYYTESGFVEP